jgi:hypothetical protein
VPPSPLSSRLEWARNACVIPPVQSASSLGVVCVAATPQFYSRRQREQLGQVTPTSTRGALPSAVDSDQRNRPPTPSQPKRNRARAHTPPAFHLRARATNPPCARSALLYSVHGFRCSWTSLHYAAIRGHDEMAQLLLRHGAHANAKDNAGCGTRVHCLRSACQVSACTRTHTHAPTHAHGRTPAGYPD